MFRQALVVPLWFTLNLASARAVEIEALVATSSSHFALTTTKSPSLGDLRKQFTGLPASCEVLVAVNASSVNPADQMTPGPFPQVMGSDMAGSVIAVETTCKRLKVGDKVWADIGAVTHTVAAAGKENGAYGQIAVALESQLGMMPRNLDFQEAAALPKVALTSYKALAWYGGAPYTQTAHKILIFGGSGGCGTTGIQIAKALGASEVITTTSGANVDYVKKLGADTIINYHSSNWWEVVADESVDVIYDTVGQPGTGDRAMKKIKPGGYYVTITGSLPTKPRRDVHSNKFINSATNLDNIDLLEALRDLVEQDRLRMPARKAYPLSEIVAAFGESAKGHVNGKLVIDLPPLASPAVQVELRV